MTKKDYHISDSIIAAMHQMRSPVYVLKGYLEALLREDMGKLNPKQKEYLSDSMENMNRVIDIINDLLRIVEIEEKEYRLSIAPVDLVKVVSDMLENYSFLAKATNTDITFQPPEKISLCYTDEKKIPYVVENLINNAISYKSQGKGLVEIEIKEREDDLLFSIKDNGEGISEENKEEVFHKFFRSHKAVEIDPTGLGLGLFISKAIVDLSGGEIWFENNKDKGVTFYFTLPKQK